MLRIHYLYHMCKAAADVSAGWYAVVNGQKNIGLVENFNYFPGRGISRWSVGGAMERWAGDIFARTL